METSASEQEIVFLDRTSRATRGKRMTNLLDDEIEEDELFWNQDALKEEEHDDNYQEEAEVADEFDSDFNEDEPEPDEEVQNETDDRKQKKKRLIYPGKPLSKKKKKKKKDLSQLEKKTKDERTVQESSPPEQNIPEDVEEERTVRKSTRTSVIVRQAEREAIQAAMQATMKPVKRRKEGEEKRMTQEEMLLDAAQTEIMNLRNLERVLAREEEVKKRAIVHKAVYTGPQIRYSSKDGRSLLEFREYSFESEIPTGSIPYPEKAVCVITGLPARYRDPKTGLPYATKEAFKIIRERLSIENSKKEIASGDLFDSLCGQGFLSRKKRSMISGKGKSSLSHYWSCSTRISVLDSSSSDY